MGGLRGERAQISLSIAHIKRLKYLIHKKLVLKGSQGGALPPQGLRDRRSLP